MKWKTWPSVAKILHIPVPCDITRARSCDKIGQVPLLLTFPCVGRRACMGTRLYIHWKNKRVAVTQLELHNNVHTSRSVTFLDHYRSPISDGRYTIKLSHVLQGSYNFGNATQL